MRIVPLVIVISIVMANCIATQNAVAANDLAENDCNLADRYTALAAKAKQEIRQPDEYAFLEKALALCESHATFLALGIVATEFANDTKTERAAQAYVRAYELANSSLQEAAALYQYAKLLHYTNNSQQALRYVYAARNLAPNDESIAMLAEDIAATTKVITKDEIVRGLGKFSLQPLNLKVDIDATGTSSGAGARISDASVNIPLNFEFGTTSLTPESQANVKVLADTLAESFSKKNVLFVGHADVRGDSGHNLSLSLGRAQAIRQQVIALHPSLDQQIAIVGKGETEPLSNGDFESDHRINRRLEIKFP